MKVCTKCGVEKSLDLFGRSPGYRDGVRPWCKDCTNAYQRAHRQIYPERYHLIARRARFKKVYGITLEQYDEMLESQGGRCAICGTSDPGEWGVLHVDHDHKTGRVRSLLCGLCNKGLGCFRDSRESLQAASEYLMLHELLLD